jgi:hypothetical protein
MRNLLRSAATPLIVGAILLGSVSIAAACWHQTVPPAPNHVYPCIPSHTGHHGGDYGSWQVWWQWLKNKYGQKWADDLKSKYGSKLDSYLSDKYAGKTTTTYFGGPSGMNGHDNDDCEPECPDGKPHSYSMSTSTYGHDDDDDDCKPDCPPDKMGSYTLTTSTYGGSYGGGGSGGHDDDCVPEKPGCGPDKTDGVAGGSGYHDGQPPKSDNRQDCPETCPKTAGGSKPDGTNEKCMPPDSGTGGCSGCKASSMTITGTVNPHGNSTQYKFEFGTTPAFGNETDWASAGNGTTAKSVSESIDGLAPGTKIYYRIVAKSIRGTVNGATKYCSTAGATKPDAVTGGTSDKKPTSATLLGSVDPNGASTTAYFQWGKTSSLGSTTGSQNVGSGDDDKDVSAGLSGLTPGTTYYYRVVATNAKGTAYGDIKSFTTPADTPKCTTGSYSSLTKSGAKLAGSVNPSGGTTSYYFDYGKTTSYGTKSGSVSAGGGNSDVAASSTLSGLSSNTKYYYRVVAVNSEGTTYGAQQSFTTSK